MHATARMTPEDVLLGQISQSREESTVQLYGVVRESKSERRGAEGCLAGGRGHKELVLPGSGAAAQEDE